MLKKWGQVMNRFKGAAQFFGTLYSFEEELGMFTTRTTLLLPALLVFFSSDFKIPNDSHWVKLLNGT